MSAFFSKVLFCYKFVTNGAAVLGQNLQNLQKKLDRMTGFSGAAGATGEDLDKTWEAKLCAGRNELRCAMKIFRRFC
jgi:hypothetical protein